MADDSPGLFLFTPLIERAEDFAPLFDSVLGAADVSSVYFRLAPVGESEAARIASRLAPLAQRAETAALFADPRIAGRANADGVHLFGQGEALLSSLEDAIASMKPQRIVGVGGTRTRHDAMSAGELDVDYMCFGDPTPDGWTPDLDLILERVEWWSAIFNVPCVGFAASLDHVAPIVAAGADFVALSDAIWADPRGPVVAAAEASEIIARTERARA